MSEASSNRFFMDRVVMVRFGELGAMGYKQQQEARAKVIVATAAAVMKCFMSAPMVETPQRLAMKKTENLEIGRNVPAGSTAIGSACGACSHHPARRAVGAVLGDG